MNPSDFEKRLQQQTMRKVPSPWRQEILGAAHAAAHSDHVSRVTHHSFISALNHQLAPLLWPCPQAWVALAAVWVVIFAANFSLRDRAEVVVQKVAPPSREVVVALRQQRQLLAELIGQALPFEAVPPKTFLPQPRSERHGALVAV
jgi:hypothetical protein